jgi:hypothetical protein
LEKLGDGSVTANEDGTIEIVAPASVPISDWQPTLEKDISGLGFSLDDGGEQWD